MIVVVGLPVLRSGAEGPTATGSGARVALTAASEGADVQLIGKVGEDPDGEAVLLALARGGVGHVAVLRDPAHRTPSLVDDPAAHEDTAAEPETRVEPADAADRPSLDVGDIELGLRYLTEFRVIVATEPLQDDAVRVLAEAAGWSNATLIIVVPEGSPQPANVPEDAILLESPAADPEGAFDQLVGRLAAAIEAGTEPRQAFRDLVSADGWEPIGA